MTALQDYVAELQVASARGDAAPLVNSLIRLLYSLARSQDVQLRAAVLEVSPYWFAHLLPTVPFIQSIVALALSTGDVAIICCAANYLRDSPPTVIKIPPVQNSR